jgi:hypothetical protein
MALSNGGSFWQEDEDSLAFIRVSYLIEDLYEVY